jgi:phosphomannomutase/phosphoglucomutase
MIPEGIFREYDIRGIAGKELNSATASMIGRAFGTFLRKINPEAKKVSVGRDVRLSSQELSSGLIEGIISTGLHVVDIGVCPTPLQYFSIIRLDLDGGVMVTGSHNPPEYNGFKLSAGKNTLYGKDISALREIACRQAPETSQVNGSVTTHNIIDEYMNYMRREFSSYSDSRFRRLKIAVDAGNGTGGIIAPELLRNMGCDVIEVYCEPDGRFPNHHPDPTVVENLTDLISVTKREKADIGIGYDGDADRIGVVDSSGNIIWGDQLMIILSRDILRKLPGSVVIGDVKCSQTMFDDIEKQGGRPVMWKTGHSLVKDKMKREKAVLAGEFSGHIFIADRYFGYDDAIYATLRLVEIMKVTGKSTDELLGGIPRMRFTPELRIDCADNRKKDVTERLMLQCKKYMESGKRNPIVHKIYDTDGTRIVFDKGWGLARMSNTQPVIVMRFEAEDEESLCTYRGFMEEQLQKAMEYN